MGKEKARPFKPARPKTLNLAHCPECQAGYPAARLPRQDQGLACLLCGTALGVEWIGGTKLALVRQCTMEC